MVISTFVYLLIFIQYSYELNNGLGRTPQMGWNSWYNVHHNITEIVVRQVADAMVATGLAAAGYQYVNMDDCWQLSRDSNGTIQPDPQAFPSGIKALADYVHSRKLKFGLYSTRGNKTCAGRPGSQGYEKKDADTYAAWEVDYLKLDSCYVDPRIPAVEQYSLMRDALNSTGRPIFYSLCGSVTTNDTWPPSVGNSWRTTTDIQGYWSAVIANIDFNNDFVHEAGPGGWNDPDMLQVGRGLMTTTEDMSHFSLWAIAKSPLILGCDVRTINTTAISILTNPEVIAVNQDPLGIQGKKVAFAESTSPNASGEVVVADCASSIDPKRRQWKYNPEDGSIRSVFNGRCLSIDHCRSGRIDFVILDDCHIGDPKALCQGKNQQWIYNITHQTIVSRMDGSCFDVYNSVGPNVDTYPCNRRINQNWMWNETDSTIRSKVSGKCLTVSLELEIWAGPLQGGSQAVLLFNRGLNDNEKITVKWTNIAFPTDHPALVRDLWARKDLGIFTGSFTSSNIVSHGVMMLNITLSK